MAQLGPLVLIFAGLTLLDGSTHLPIPVAAWIGLLLILHGSRSLPSLATGPCVWLAAATILAISERGSIPASGAGYLIGSRISSLPADQQARLMEYLKSLPLV